MLGVIITAFMVGLAVGAYIANMGLREMGRREFVLMEVAIAVLSMLISAAIIWLNTLESVRAVFLGSKIIFPLLASVLAILVGMEFPLASKLSFEEVASTSARLYNADLIGASVGALVVSTLLIPILGIVKVCLLVGAMNIASGTLVSFKG
jgi:predicted membrane-bound spermidine synthase